MSAPLAPPDRARPRVVLLHNYLTPYRVPLFEELAQRFDLEVWVLGDVRRIREWTDSAAGDARVRRLPSLSLPMGSRDYRLLLNPTAPAALHRARFDAAIVTGWDTPAAWYAAHALRRPWVLWSGSTAGEPNWRRSLMAPLVRGVVRRASAWLAYGTRARAYLASLGADPDRTFIAGNAVALEPLRPYGELDEPARAALQDQLGLGDGPLVAYAGQLIARKGLGDLLPAFAEAAVETPGLTLAVAGSGPEEERFRRQAKALGVNGRVRFLGFIERDALPRLYAAASLFALPSRQEVWGLVLNEALACGTPVLTTTATGAAADLVRDGENGYVTSSGDTAAMARALTAHFSGVPPEQARPLATREAARASVASYTPERMADAFEQAVDCALGIERPGGAPRTR